MERFVLVMVLNGTVHAYGLFVSEHGCWMVGDIATQALRDTQINLVNVCYPEARFRRLFPQLAVEEPAT